MEPGEEAAVCALATRVFNDLVARDLSPEGIAEFSRYARPEAMAARAGAGHTVLVAEDENGLAGVLELRGLDHIAMLFVETRGRGVGRALVERAVEICRDGAPEVRQVTVHASRYAAPIYRKLGFRAAGVERTEAGITYLPMRLDLEDLEQG